MSDSHFLTSVVGSVDSMSAVARDCSVCKLAETSDSVTAVSSCLYSMSSAVATDTSGETSSLDVSGSMSLS